MSGARGRDAIRVGITAVYPAVRAGLRAMLAAEERIEVVAEATDPRDLSAEIDHGLEVVLIDLDREGGWEGLESLLAPAAISVVLLGPAGADAHLPELLRDRPWAYLLREAGGEELARAIEAVAQGLVVLQPPLARRLLAPPHPGALDEELAGHEALTPRELDVLRLVAEGLPNKTIATRLRISEHTVKFHITAILAKLGAASRTEAVRLGARRGLIAL